ncbi:MAG: alpha-amylase family glycosyl hydrolase, partial [Spirochaetales bacterium]|nr:alpha-amylase family glycosyl hydrolase [Spirochaetales bacterium]
FEDCPGFGEAYNYYGVHMLNEDCIIREWAPNATEIFLLADVTGWQPSVDYSFKRLNEHGDWELKVSQKELGHENYYRLLVRWPGGEGERIPAYAERVVQDSYSYVYSAQVWSPSEKYKWKYKNPEKNESLLIYEAHIGMATEEYGVGTYDEFRTNVLPRIVNEGFTAVQFMALMEHPYYGSFGYQVSNFFALTSKYGTPEEFKQLVDECHKYGLIVIMDLIHSHAVRNEVEGISCQDGTLYQYFHDGGKGFHPAWDSRCFDYNKDDVLNFLLSNCAYWINEYHIDGYRFDGVTSMLYFDHGLGSSFDHYDKYFNGNVDEDAFLYLSLANYIIHRINPNAITIAEDMSGMPGIARSPEIGGGGFDYRLAMGLPDYWIKILKHVSDENWSPGQIWETLNNRRFTEKNIAYSESHDQALVGDKTLIFRMIDSDMYTCMTIDCTSLTVSRGMALIKIINLLTFSLGGDGYMCFMGNEFGHPEWIDFPREGNGWDYHYARRQWSLADNKELRYSRLLSFSRDMLTHCCDSLLSKYSDFIIAHESDKVLCYKRGDLYYFVNMNPSISFKDYGIEVPAGDYELVLNTDSVNYDGEGRVPDTLILKTLNCSDGVVRITPYLPCRTALVFKKIKGS